jgi:ParB family chromosome partitioning protein
MNKSTTKAKAESGKDDVSPIFEDRDFRLGELGIAPEQPRAKEPADDGIPQLAETIAAAEIVERLLVRPGRKSERPAMILNGRRRFLAASLLLESGRIDENYVVRCRVAMNKAAEIAALFLPSEHLPVHIADVVAAIGKLRKAKMDTAVIARALGYEEHEIRRLMLLSTAHPKVIDALRQGRINLKQARLLARLTDRKEQATLAENAIYYGISEHSLRQRLTGGRLPLSDARFAFVGLDRYAAAGGRTESDLFGEFPDMLLDPAVLDTEWQKRAASTVEALKAAGATVFVASYRWYQAPDGYDALSHCRRPQLDEPGNAALAAAEAIQEARAEALAKVELGDDGSAQLVADLTVARFGTAKAIYPDRDVTAAVIYPCDQTGVDVDFAAIPLVKEEAGEGGQEDDYHPALSPEARRQEIEIPTLSMDIEGRSHVLHETYTDVATRGLIRDLADSPAAALTAVIAQLFKLVGLNGHVYAGESALTIKASRYARVGHPAIDLLDGEVRARLDSRREAYLASGLRPIPWVDSLPHGEKMALLAELAAMTLDLREPRTSNLNPAARVEAAEIAELAGSDISAHWSPDEPFLKVHGKKQLMALLGEMGADDAQAKSLRKEELVVFVAEQAAERQWAPEALTWRLPVPPEPEGDDASSPDADRRTGADSGRDVDGSLPVGTTPSTDDVPALDVAA